MKKTLVMGSVLVAGLALSSCQNGGAKSSSSVKLQNETDSASYAMGVLQGSGMNEQLENMPGGPKFNTDAILAGITDGFKNDSTKFKISTEEAQDLIRVFFQKQREKFEKEAKERQDSIIKSYVGKDGYVQTASGLIYRVVTEGTGEKPKKDDNVKVKYTGKLYDGKVFDSTDDRGGEPAVFPVGAVIPGWTEALQMMPVGSKWELIIPSELAYGPRAMGDIAPFSVLFFDVELLEIAPKDAK